MAAGPPVAALPHWVPAYVALGSNLGHPEHQVERAFEALRGLPQSRLVLRSSLYRSRPMGPVTQPDFVNAVAGLLTQLDARALLQHLKTLESQLGRAAPIVRWGPRLIDLDLLAHGSTRLAEPAITVPHAALAERDFVLVPLAEIAPSLDLPGVGRVAVLVQRLGASELERIGT